MTGPVRPIAAVPPRRLDRWERALLNKLSVATRTDRKTGEETHVIRPTSANAATILREHPEWRGVLALNTFHGQIEATRAPPWHRLDAPTDGAPGPWKDGDDARLSNWFERTWIADTTPITVGPRNLESAILVAAEANAYHPVRDYLRGLTWDGTPRVDDLARLYLGAVDTPYTRAVGACLLLGAVARVMRPGCKLDTCPILEGPQGALKSSFLERLGSPWFADSKIPIGSKDAYENIRGVWLYELGELASLSKSDIETTKAFISSRTDHYRPSYGKRAIDVPRQTAFVGTTNGTNYLHDATGGRRFPPLRIGTIDLRAVERDRDQLWAETVARFDRGEAWWFSGELAAEAAREVEERFVVDPWEERIREYLNNPARLLHGVTTEELLTSCGVETGQRTTGHAMRVSAILGRLSWGGRRRTRGDDGARAYRYFKVGGDS